MRLCVSCPLRDTISKVEHRLLGIERTDDTQIANVGLTAIFSQEDKMSDAIPMKIKKLTGGGKGEAQFDVARGRLIKWTLNEQMKMGAEVYGKAVNVVTTGTQKWQLAD